MPRMIPLPEKLFINDAVEELMRLKPDVFPVNAWRVLVLYGTVEDIVSVSHVNRDQVERLVRDARGSAGNDEDGIQEQQRQLAAPQAETEIHQSHSRDTGDTWTTPSDLVFSEPQQQPTGLAWRGFVQYLDRLRHCCNPWLHRTPPNEVGVSVDGQVVPAVPAPDGNYVHNNPHPLNLLEGLVAVHGPPSEPRGTLSVSTVGLPLSEESRRNPQDMDQSGPGERVGLFRRGNQSE